MKTITCTYHCSARGLHFHPLDAFDRHRVGSWDEDVPLNSEHGRRCLYPIDIQDSNGSPCFEPLTDDGECRMYDDGSGTNTSSGVTVWTLVKSPAQRQWLSSLR
jgi:hypothetical protein